MLSLRLGNQEGKKLGPINNKLLLAIKLNPIPVLLLGISYIILRKEVSLVFIYSICLLDLYLYTVMYLGFGRSTSTRKLEQYNHENGVAPFLLNIYLSVKA
jgi:hypothetical protein